MWAAPALLAALAWFVVLVSRAPESLALLASTAPASFAAQAIALALAGKMVVEPEFPAKAPLVAPNA